LAGLVHAHAPSTARATVISVLALTRKLGLALWAPVMGAVVDRSSISHAYGACAAGLLATAAGVVSVAQENDQK
jgi:predicted MFS family arabinose efflux permease